MSKTSVLVQSNHNTKWTINENAVSTLSFIKALDEVDRQYGSLEGYLREVIGLTDLDIRVLRERYLEELSQTLQAILKGTVDRHLHHLLRTLELLDEAVDVCDGSP